MDGFLVLIVRNISGEWTNLCALSIKIFMIPIFWDIYRVIVENFEMVSELINNLIHKCIKNPLKDASFFTVV